MQELSIQMLENMIKYVNIFKNRENYTRKYINIEKYARICQRTNKFSMEI